MAQLKCSWKQGVIMRNILTGCGRGSCQSSSIKLNIFLSFLKDWSLHHGAQSVIESVGSGFTKKSFSPEETDVFMWEVQNCC